jgi:iron complex transport system substrate-binding protein
VAGRDFPQRIVCLTEEPTEILYDLGEGDRVVGISAYTCRPAAAREEKPVVSAFIGGSVDKISELAPDLVIGFSDIQADLARQLIERGLQVLIFNQRSIAEILDVILAVGRLVGAEARAEELVRGHESHLAEIRRRAAAREHRPRVYFEEWDDPTICGIAWVSELVELAGGEDIFAERARGVLAKERIVEHEAIREAAPEVVLASWCGKPFDGAAFRARPGFEELPAVRAGRVHELDPSIILQPGPACLSDGVDAIVAAIEGA